jgi:hypothetical protein
MIPAPVMDGTPAQATHTLSHDPGPPLPTAASANRTDPRPPYVTIGPPSRRSSACVPTIPTLVVSASPRVLPIHSGRRHQGLGQHKQP